MAEQAEDRATAVDADNEIAQRIWTRYGDSPGVIPMGSTLGLARRISRWSTGRLPLLDEIQRRWAPGGPSYLHGAVALPYARPPAVPVTQLTPGIVPRGATVPGTVPGGAAAPGPTPMHSAGLQRAALAQPVASKPAPQMPIVRAERAQVIQAAARGSEPGSTGQQRHLSGSGERVIQRQRAGPGPQTPSQLARTSEATTTGLSSPSGAPSPALPIASTGQGTRQTGGVGIQRAAEAGTMSRTAPSASELGVAIVRRHLSGPAERAIQQPQAWPEPGGWAGSPRLPGRAVIGFSPQASLQMATVTLTRAGPTTLSKSSAHLDPVAPAGLGTPPPGDGRAPHLVRAQAMPQPSTISGGSKLAIQPRPLSGQAGRMAQPQQARPVPRQDRTMVEAPRSEAESQPASGGAQPTTAGQAAPARPGEAASQPASGRAQAATGIRLAPATATTTGDLGATILQRHLGGPVERAIRHGSSPLAAAYPTPGLILRSFAPGMAGPASPQTVHLARQALEAAPVAGQPPAVTGGEARLDSQALGLGQNTGVAAAGSGTPSADTPGPVWMPLSRAVGSRAGPNIMRRPAMPLARSIQPGMGAVDPVPGPAGQPYPFSQELLLSPAAERGAAGPEAESAPPSSSSVGQSGAVVTHWLQRAPAGSSPATPAAAASATAPAGGPTPLSAAPPSAAPPASEGPDLERLADQVYMILERRLIMERESLGL